MIRVTKENVAFKGITQKEFETLNGDNKLEALHPEAASAILASLRMMDDPQSHVFATGSRWSGKSFAIKSFLRRLFEKHKELYFRDLQDQVLLVWPTDDNAVSVRHFYVPQGQGKKLKEGLHKIYDELAARLKNIRAKKSAIETNAGEPHQLRVVDYKSEIEEIFRKYLSPEICTCIEPWLTVAKPYIHKVLNIVTKKVLRSKDKNDEEESAVVEIERDLLVLLETAILVDNSDEQIPIIWENKFFTYRNLFFCAEEAEDGQPLNFLDIKAGELFTKQFLFLSAQSLINNRDLCPRLLTALETKQAPLIIVNYTGIGTEVISGFSNVVIPVTTKVFIVGTNAERRYLINKVDRRFETIFTDIAHFRGTIKARKNIRAVASTIRSIANDLQLPPIHDAEAMNKLLTELARASGSRCELSLKFKKMKWVLKRVGKIATLRKRASIKSDDIHSFLKEERYKNDFHAKNNREYLIQYGDFDFKKALPGSMCGIVVYEEDDHCYAVPQRVTARAIITPEKSRKIEITSTDARVKKAGPNFLKSLEIIHGILDAQLIHLEKEHPRLLFNVHIYINIEQNSDDIDGPSMTAVTLLIALSELAGIAINPKTFMTGAMGLKTQNIHAIGAVNDKIRGVWAFCRDKKINNYQILVPQKNFNEILLDDEMADDLNKTFEIIAVANFDEVIKLTTGYKPKAFYKKLGEMLQSHK